MKKLLLLVAVLTFTVGSALAQGFQFGAKVGGNFSNVVGGGDYTKYNKGKIGFNVGATVDYGFNEKMFLFSGLELTTKGFKIDESFAKLTANAMYLQLPIHFAYKIAVGSGPVKLVPEAGLYVAYGIGGKVKTELFGEEEKDDYFGDPKKGYCKAFDLGVGAAFGAEFGKIGVKVGYDYGLLNMVDDEDDSKYKNMNSNVYLSVGYKF